MKNITILILTAFLSCSQPTKTTSVEPQALTAEDIDKFRWLEGVWERSMDGSDNMNHFETWAVGDGQLHGTGTTIMGEDVTNEVIKIVPINDSLYYIAHPAQNESPTSFYISEIKERYFRCENNLHDFPKYIEYSRHKDTLNAYIGDEHQRIHFQFTKQDERHFR